MKSEKLIIGNRNCSVFHEEQPEAILLLPEDEASAQDIAEELYHQTKTPFLMAVFEIKDWNKELSPWDAPPVFGKEDFGHGAIDTLSFIENDLLPLIYEHYHCKQDLPVILTGYSLAGLFALWSAYQTDRFTAIAAVSPSVWFQNWISYSSSHTVKAEHVYLSLGDREEKTRNQQMAKVGDCIKEMHTILSKDTDCILEWNEGNHFKDPDKRVYKGLLWCLNTIKNNEMEI